MARRPRKFTPSRGVGRRYLGKHRAMRPGKALAKTGFVVGIKFGDWDRVTLALERTMLEGPNRFATSCETFANNVKRHIQELIIKGNFTTNSEWSHRAKGHNKPLVFTQEYFNAIKISAASKRVQKNYVRSGVMSWDIDIEEGAMHGPIYEKNADGEDSGRLLAEPAPMIKVAEGLEFGRGYPSRVPPRPHWAPTIEWAQRNAYRNVRANIKMNRFLNRAGWSI